MANGNNNPSIGLDPASQGSLAGTLSFVYNKLMQQTDGMLPAKVIAYDRTTNRVQVQLLISILTTDGSLVSRAQIASLPVLLLGGGGFAITFPLVTGDLGWVAANDRDISLFLQGYTEAGPNTARVKNFSDAVFIPDAMHNVTISGDDTDSMTIQSLDGTVRVSLGVGTATITAPLITLNGAVVITGALEAEGGFTGTGGAGPNPFDITGNLLVTGNIGATGSITPFV